MRGLATGTTVIEDLTLPGNFQKELPEHALAVITVPVYGGRVAPPALARLKEIRGNHTPAVIAVVYGNRAYEKALEELGHKKIVSNLIPFDTSKKESEGRFSDRTANEIVRASFEMGAVKTGALIVIEEETVLNEYIRTGINLDSLVSSQLLINIFEHNTPLHDGAVIIRGDRIVAATCYLPLSDNLDLNKNLGTRHRAGVGISEVSDALTVIVSEETGRVSVTKDGEIHVGLNKEELRKILEEEQNKTKQEKVKHRLWKGLVKNEKKSNE